MQVTSLQFGVYRDGDNNLDTAQAPVIDQAFRTSAHDRLVAFTIEDTTARRDPAAPGAHGLRTESYSVRDGAIEGDVAIDAPHDPSSRANLAHFVARTLDEAQRNGADRTWIDLVDHGGGDGGGLESAAHANSLMKSDDIAGAIADGIALHAREHPEDAARTLDGVVANQCLMATLSFADALSHAGVKYLAASPEVMLAPGAPSSVAEDIVRHDGDPQAMAKAIVARTMHTAYGIPGDTWGPAAAFDVIDCDPQKVATMESAVRTLDGALARAALASPEAHDAIVEDGRATQGMTRFSHASFPWHADRPALQLYDTLAEDTRLSTGVRAAAKAAHDAVANLVLAHGESTSFEPFGGASYRDAAGPTVHFPTAPSERDPWAPHVRESTTAFHRAVGAARLDRVIA